MTSLEHRSFPLLALVVDSSAASLRRLASAVHDARVRAARRDRYAEMARRAEELRRLWMR